MQVLKKYRRQFVLCDYGFVSGFVSHCVLVKLIRS